MEQIKILKRMFYQKYNKLKIQHLRKIKKKFSNYLLPIYQIQMCKGKLNLDNIIKKRKFSKTLIGLMTLHPIVFTKAILSRSCGIVLSSMIILKERDNNYVFKYKNY